MLTGLILTYWKRKRQMKKLLDMAEQLSERYLISEVMELPEQAEDQVYYQLLKMAGKSMLEQIGEVEREMCIRDSLKTYPDYEYLKEDPDTKTLEEYYENVTRAYLTDCILKDQDRKSTRLNSSHLKLSRMPSSA